MDRGSTFLKFNFHHDAEEINHYCGHTSLQINALAGMLLVVARVQSPKRNINAIDGCWWVVCVINLCSTRVTLTVKAVGFYGPHLQLLRRQVMMTMMTC